MLLELEADARDVRFCVYVSVVLQMHVTGRRRKIITFIFKADLTDSASGNEMKD